MNELKFSLILMAAALFVGCTPQTQQSELQTPTESSYPGPGLSELPTVEAYPAPPAQATVPIPYPVPQDSQSVVEIETPTIKEGLVATNPALVNLASGEPTFVEFFAFW